MSTTKTQSQTPHLQRFSDEWETKRVSEFGDIVTGETPSIKITAFWDGSYPWITPTDITSDRDMIASERMVTQEGLNSIRRSLPPNTVLVTCIASIGKNAILKTTGSCNQQINAVVPNTAHNAEFLYYLFEHNSNYLLGNAGVTATPIISKSVFSEFVFQVPPLSEQRAIAEALSDVDGLLNALDALIAKKQAIKQATMQQLLTGKTRLPGFSGAWEMTRMGQIGSIYGGLSGKSKIDFGVGNARYVTFLGVLENIILDTCHTERVHVGSGESQNRVMKGDLLFNASSETPGDLAIGAVMGEQLDNLYLNSFCFGFRIHDEKKHVPLFLAYFFRGSVGRAIMNALAQGATRYNMSKSQFLALELSIPSGDEQRAIASVLSDMDAEITALEQRREKTRAIKQGMMQQLLTGRVRLVKFGTVSKRSRKLKVK